MTGRSRRAGHFLWRHRTGLSVLVFAAGVLAVPLVVTNEYRLGILNLVGLHVIVALGLNLFVGYTGQISLGHAAFYGLGAYGTAILTTVHDVPGWAALPIAAAGTGLIALVVGLPALRLAGHYLAMATLGFNYVVHVVFVQWDRVTGGPSGISEIPPMAAGPLLFKGEVGAHYLIWGTALAVLALSINLVRSGLGRGLAALAHDETAAACLGVDVRRAKVGVFVFSAVTASVAGSLYAHYFGYVNPDPFSVFASLDMVIMVVVGGLGSLWGTLVGASFVTTLPHLLGGMETWKDVVQGLLLVVILIFLPQGLITGLVETARVWLARRRLGGFRGRAA